MVEEHFTATVLAEAEAPKKGGGGGDLSQLLVPFVMIAVVWYFLLLRPQRREAIKREGLLRELKKNDRVVTYSGMIGTISSISQDGREVTLKVDDNTRIRFLKSAIQMVLRDEAEEAAGEKPADKPTT